MPLIEVVNMSLAGGGSDDGNCGFTNFDLLHQAVCRVERAGVTMVAAAGNEATDTKGYVPAAYDEVITVSALADYDGKPGGLAPSRCPAVPAPMTPSPRSATTARTWISSRPVFASSRHCPAASTVG